METAAPGNGPALPLPTPPETPHHISATVVLALVHADSRPAEENVDLLRRRIEGGSSSVRQTPWSDRIDVASLEIRSEGRLLLAKLRGPISRSYLDLLTYRDNLIVHD